MVHDDHDVVNHAKPNTEESLVSPATGGHEPPTTEGFVSWFATLPITLW